MGFLCLMVNFVLKWAQNRSNSDEKGFYVFNLMSLKMSQKSAEIWSKEISCLTFYFVEKWAPNRSKADTKAFYVFYSNYLKNESQIGQRPIKEEIMFYFNLLKNEPQIGRRPIKEETFFLVNFDTKLIPNRSKSDKRGFLCF